MRNNGLLITKTRQWISVVAYQVYTCLYIYHCFSQGKAEFLNYGCLATTKSQLDEKKEKYLAGKKDGKNPVAG